MSDNQERKHKKKKKKSFLYNMMCTLTNRRSGRVHDGNSSSDNEEYGHNSQHTSSSKSPARRKSPTSKNTTSGKHKINTASVTAAVTDDSPAAGNGQENQNNWQHFEHPDNVIHLSGHQTKHDNGQFSDSHNLRLTGENDTPTCVKDGSDRNIKLKEAFAQYVKPNGNEIVCTEKQSIQGQQPAVATTYPHTEQLDKSQKYLILSKKEVLDASAPHESEMKAVKKLLIKEKNNSKKEGSSDSDESDTTESMYSDSPDSGDDEPNIGELYFTTGKYITHFFLEMERYKYDPEAEKYSYIHYHESSVERTKKGELSSSDSASPNICTHVKQKLLHRRSVDNLVASSAPTSIEHSSPESIKSVPIQLKPRSSSNDAITRKKERYTQGAASMDNLAKQTLLAARVLNLMPAQQARERNFLHGRIAANSLLGPGELEKVLPNREVTIFVGTWNMNGQTPPKELNDFMLPSDIQTIPDILAIGTQESCSERTEWEAAIQETLGPSHVLLTSASLGTLHLALFLRRDLVWFCSVPEDDSFSTRPGTAFRTKGGVAIGFILFGTSFLFVTAHLTAHQEKVKERVHDIKKIVRNLELPQDLPTKHKSKDVTQNFDCVFWCGDLNFRMAQPREEIIQWVTNTCWPTETAVNLSNDQLRMVLNEGSVLRGFEEGPITFPPTYKYDPGTQTFDSSSKQRTPSYTDRILFKGKTQPRGYMRRVSHESSNLHKDGHIECLVYDSVLSICTSDHKPVWGVFKTTVRPGIDTIPLAAGLFNREIYLEGIRRRVATMDSSFDRSKDCSLQ